MIIIKTFQFYKPKGHFLQLKKNILCVIYVCESNINKQNDDNFSTITDYILILNYIKLNIFKQHNAFFKLLLMFY